MMEDVGDGLISKDPILSISVTNIDKAKMKFGNESWTETLWQMN